MAQENEEYVEDVSKEITELDRLVKRLEVIATEEQKGEMKSPAVGDLPLKMSERVRAGEATSEQRISKREPSEDVTQSSLNVKGKAAGVGKVPRRVRKTPVKKVKKHPPTTKRTVRRYKAASVPRAVPGAVTAQIAMVKKVSSDLIREVSNTVLGKERVLQMVVLAILSDGHVLFEDYPGLAKTLMANTFARALGCRFKRVQFTPDLLPADITGTYVFDEKISDFKFREGPIFTNILLADEINRSPPKTQAALLEAMQERQVTLEGVTRVLPKPFIVIATQNPIEYEGTYSLPEAQLDRFLIRISVGYPSENVERRILMDRMERRKDETDVKQIADPETILRMQRGLESVHISDAVISYIVGIVRSTRKDPRVMVGASPRGSLAIFKLSRAKAAVEGRDYVIPDDVKFVAVQALNHRIILNPEPRIMGVRPDDVIRDILREIPVPVVE